ncbi:TetR/AcrR family transcriptional regulator [Nitrospirillum pindoramense]|uniref:TetR family transcriptional regulator n=1 Tax=Nitrospirillum amazonense TaxID=28077 RepID=A0A560GU88_9PROT|nr:helix-turn-helix domain-containing protein [Nitrospirillum amazonense]TWB37596.1 TetR family transcriptional regulator [Nitrospirillum amazonense]
MAEKTLKPGTELLTRVRQAFLTYGYSDLTMVDLAEACGFTRRALYHYFRNKEDAFKASTWHENTMLIRAGLEAGGRVRQAGGSALDIITEVMDVRYGYARRVLAKSPHIIDLTAEVLKRCRDQMVEAAAHFQSLLEKLLRELEGEGLLRLAPEFTHAMAAQTLSDGGRAVTQDLSAVPDDMLTTHYRAMCRAVLYGCATLPATLPESSVRSSRASL